MALLSSCWLLVEFFIIPDGLIKWFYLSLYVHPIFLIFCQIFLWLRWPAYIIFFLPFKITCYLYSITLVYYRRFVVIILRSFARSSVSEVVYDDPGYENIPESLISCHEKNLILGLYSTTATAAEFTHSYEVSVYKVSKLCLEEVDHDDGCSEEIDNANVNEEYSSSDEEDSLFLSSIKLSDSPSFAVLSPRDDHRTNLTFPSLSVCQLHSTEQELTTERDDKEEEIDQFYEEYKEKMRWFDLLNHDRAFALSQVQSEQSALISTERREKVDIQWAKMAKKRMVKSLENDIEVVYVSQLCLTWEAIYHQYQKALEFQLGCSFSSSTPISDGAFYYNTSHVVGEFQKFKILLERFMEDERLFDGHRYWNYVQKRSSPESLLQVPNISTGSAMEGEIDEREMVTTELMLKAIEKCIKTFLLFLQTEKRKQWWKANSLVWTRPPLEDPRDLKLFHDLIKTLQKKELWLKDLKGKKKCWLKRAINRLEESQKKEMLFAMIEMKLIARVISMSMISTRQLNWCQEKLRNIEFKEGKVIRSYPIVQTTSSRG